MRNCCTGCRGKLIITVGLARSAEYPMQLRQNLEDGTENPAYIFAKLKVGYRMAQGLDGWRLGGQTNFNELYRFITPFEWTAP